jgi:hypothetical protein
VDRDRKADLSVPDFDEKKREFAGEVAIKK